MKSYIVEENFGFGGQGETMLARDPDSGHRVVIKRLGFDALGTWKDRELFEREIEILQGLDHQLIPKLLDYEKDGETLVLVYEYVEGQTLNELLEDHEPDGIFNETEARAFLRNMLNILKYLHSRRPPVVHRDIKPSNIVKKPDGAYALIDFGAAQATTRLTSGSTFVIHGARAVDGTRGTEI